MTRYGLYGLVVDSEIDLHQERPATGPADVTVRLGAPMTTTIERPAGRTLLHLETPERTLFTATEQDDGDVVIRFHGTADVLIDRTLRQVVVHTVAGADPDVVGVLTAGMVLSFILAMRGEPVLHASAVQVGGRAVGFVGRSGMGKSTLATLLCASGARLITDDVLRLDLSEAGARCFLGATALRLRKGADDLSALFDSAPERRVTGDGRDALTMTASVEELLPLAALVVPAPRHDADQPEPELVRLDKKTALVTLLQFPRIVGWQDPAVLDRQLQELGRVVSSVPVYLARLPWGPPFAPTLAAAVIEALGLDVPAAPARTERAGTGSGPQ